MTLPESFGGDERRILKTTQKDSNDSKIESKGSQNESFYPNIKDILRKDRCTGLMEHVDWLYLPYRYGTLYCMYIRTN
jgi:hypothetical protein